MSGFNAEVMWDYEAFRQPAHAELASRAFARKLFKMEEDALIEVVKANPTVVFDWGYTPESIPTLTMNACSLVGQMLIGLSSDPIVTE
jgi:hypothetical protein